MKENKKKLTRRDFLKTATITAGTAFMMNPSFPLIMRGKAYASNSDKVKVGVIAPSHCALSMIHAYHSGIYKKNGVDAEIVFLPDMPDIAKALIKGDIDVGQLISPVFFAINAGSGPFKGKATPLITAQVAGTNGGVLVVGKNSPIKRPQDMVGKNIGVHSPLMVHSLLINTLLKRNKIDPTKDLKIKITKMSDLIPALKKGEIDAFINPEPLGTFAKNKVAAREMMITKNLWFKHPCCLVSVRRDFFENDPEKVKAIYRSSIESGLLLNDVKTRNDHIDKIYKDSKPYSRFPVSALKKAFMPGRSDFDPFPYQSSGKAVLAMMKDFKLMPKSVNTDKIISETFQSDLSRELFSSLGGISPKNNNRMEKIVGKVMS